MIHEPDAPPLPGDEHDPTRSGGSSAVDQLRAKVLHGGAIGKLPPLEPLVDGWLDLDTIAVMYGRPGAGKSLVALDLALHVATNSWWNGHEVHQADVLYVVAEGAAGTGKRVEAWQFHNRHWSEIDRIHWIAEPVNLLDVTKGAALAQVAADLEARFVVIDTLNRSMPGGDENSSRDMGHAIGAADRIRVATRGCVLIVHHSGKDPSAGSRGHSSLLGAVATELELKSSDGLITITNSKQKDHAEADSLRLALVPVPTADSVAIGPSSQRVDTADELTAKAQAALDSLRSIDIEGGVAATQWQTVACSDQAMAASTFWKHRTALVRAGLVRQIGEGRSARYSPLTRENT